MLRFLAATPGVDNFDLVLYCAKEPSVTADEFESGAGMRFRGAARPGPEEIIRRVREFMDG